MVNIGGRSKGCLTCRKRRVKCDEHRPVCRRCQRWGFECTGMRDITFVEGTIVKSRRSEKRPGKTPDHSIGSADSVERRIPFCTSLQSNVSEIYVCYARKYLRQGAPLDLALQGMRLDDIIAAEMNTSSEYLFHRAFLSFTILIYGIQHMEKHTTEKGLALRGAALKHLNHALSEPDCYARDDVVLSVVVFAMLDSIVPTGRGQYLKHMLGLQTLLGLRDSRSPCFQQSVGLYKAVRHMIIFASLRTSKPSIFARPEWKAVLRANCSDQESQEQDLFDVLADCTVVQVQLGDALQQNEARDKARLLLARLYDWRNKWDDDKRNACINISTSMQEPVHNDLRNEVSTCPFPTLFDFSDVSVAAMFMFYNTALIYVFRILAIPGSRSSSTQSLTKDLAMESHGSVREEVTNDYAAAEQQAALDIYRSIPKYLERRSLMCTNPAPNVHWAVSTAWDTLGGHESTYGGWLKELLDTRGQDVVAQGLWSVQSNNSLA